MRTKRAFTIHPNIERNYINALKRILDNGYDIDNERTGVGTRMITNVFLEHENVEDKFPMLLSKRVAWKPMVGELLWFIEGSTDIRRLAELTYGDPKRDTIWTANYQDLVRKYSEGMIRTHPQNDLGPVYGAQWRSWDPGVDFHDIDQLADVIERIKTNPADRRLVVSAWNPGDIPDMALPPCHMIFQFNVVGNQLDLAMFQRSGDMFLGVPFNIASYALLMKLVARETGLQAGKLSMMIGNAHIYSNHFEQVNRQIDNWHKKVSGWDLGTASVSINTEQSLLSGELTANDFVLADYNPIETIKGDMAV